MACQDHILCPSNRCKPGSDLLGVRQDDGTVAILPQPLPVDQQFVDIVSRAKEAPEERFRFSNKCVQSGCSQWTGSRCGVIDKFTRLFETEPTPSIQKTGAVEKETAENEPIETSLPACSIRPTCRWHLQSGPAACRVCPLIITHITEADTILPLNK